MENFEIRHQLIKHLRSGEAFLPLKEFIDKVPFEKIQLRPAGLPYSVYELFFHLKYAQKDILNFCVSETYKTPEWPKDYWPVNQGPENEKEWENLKTDFFKDQEQLETIILNGDNYLEKPVKNGDGQTLLREILLVIEHNAYHTGQLIILARLLGAYS